MTLPSLIKLLIQVIVLTILVLTLVAAGQMTQYILSTREIRFEALTHWKNSNPEQSALVDKYVSLCLSGEYHKLKHPNESRLPVDNYDCGNTIGAHELVQKMQQVDSQLGELAWPLSLVE
ncbi:hypothetical protein [Vibrio hepatarius]|uniref:hypothetical protein n=1 Tax=Vibrio hepatarius TaxID=171383 RepID=UPI003734DC9F